MRRNDGGPRAPISPADPPRSAGRARQGAPSLVGAVIGGRYRLVQLLASGGTGDVYLAAPVDEGARPRVAIKALRAEHRAVPSLVHRFRREAEAAARVRHPNVLAVLEPLEEAVPVGSAGHGSTHPPDPRTPGPAGSAPRDPVLYFATELLVGLDLADTLAHARALGSPRAVGIAAAVAEGLAAAHAAGVIHRDVKPENVFLVHAADGREAVKLLDFGFAFLPGDDAPGASVVGTPEYMAPEQARGAIASPTADVYSLGVVLFEMLAGRPPFVGSYPDVARAHAEEQVPSIASLNPRAVVSRDLEAVILRALAKEPWMRFASMGELLRALLGTPEGRALPRRAPPARPDR